MRHYLSRAFRNQAVTEPSRSTPGQPFQPTHLPASAQALRSSARAARARAHTPTAHWSVHTPRLAPPAKSPPTPPQRPCKQDARRRPSQSRVRGAGRGKTGRVSGAPLKVAPTTQPHGDRAEPPKAPSPTTQRPMTRGTHLEGLETALGRVRGTATSSSLHIFGTIAIVGLPKP